MDIFIFAFFALLGAVVGSFLNVVILRFGFSESPAPRSHCAHCHTQLTARDLVPVLSYLVLGGRCRSCGSSISAQYPLVEITTGALFALTYSVLGVPGDAYALMTFLSFLGFWSSLVALVTYDVRHTLVPMQFIYALWAFSALGVLAVALQTQSILVPGLMLLGGIIPAGFFALITFFTKGKGMGIGDSYVALGTGTMLGFPLGIISVILGVWAGALFGLSIILLQKVFPLLRRLLSLRRVTLKTELPFAPFLALGAVVAFAIGSSVTEFFF